jgi:hypothetical protein
MLSDSLSTPASKSQTTSNVSFKSISKRGWKRAREIERKRERRENILQCTLRSRFFYQFNCYLHLWVNICSHSFKLSYMLQDGSAPCSLARFESSSRVRSRVIRDFRRKIEEEREKTIKCFVIVWLQVILA